MPVESAAAGGHRWIKRVGLAAIRIQSGLVAQRDVVVPTLPR